ncbi:MAG: histidine phosphatase family protein [Chloroflexi bacterium]|nr:histidine phosphatase family protein [Chloroflexota bacterium]
MTTLLLIRHGKNDYLKKGILIGNTPGVHLNQHGHEQAAALCASLKDIPIKAIYSSPLERAIETASPLASVLSLEIAVRPALADTDVGEWAGRKVKELKKLPAWKQVQEKPSGFIFPGGESFVELQRRLVGAIDVIAAAHKKNDLVAIFFHADPIKLVLAHFLGLPLDNFQRLSVDTGSVSVLGIGKSGARLAALNLKPPFDLPHL